MDSRGHLRTSTAVIGTPDERLRVFVSSTLNELAAERQAVRDAVLSLHLHPVMFEAGSRAHPPAELYRSYLEQSDVFVGIYWQSYGWVGAGEEVSGIEDEYLRSAGKPRLLYIKEPGPDREPRLQEMLDSFRDEGSTTYRHFASSQELGELVLDDLAVLVTERFRALSSEPTFKWGTLTFLFADIDGSTGLLRNLGDTYSNLLSQYNAVVHRATAQNHGHVASSEGDGLFAVFTDPIDAAKAAVSIQSALAASNWPGGVQPRCRIGLHTGQATRTEDGYVGLDVHIASRIGDAARGGQILLSTGTAQLLRDHADTAGWGLSEIGHYELRGVGRSESLTRLDPPNLPVADGEPRARPRATTTVPSMARSLVGRQADLAGATEMLTRESVRMVTITGSGGTGKTRLAIELTHQLDAHFPDGVVFVDVSSIDERDRFLPLVGRALGVRESKDRSIVEALKSVIGDASMLLVLDNMEQILPAAPDVGSLIETLPNIKILATSRAPLRIGWENEYPLLPLSVPAEGAYDPEIDQSAAVRLFTERARAVRPGFELNEVTRPVVAEITRRLDGLPLAIELAAARTRTFSVEQLLERLRKSLLILDRGMIDLPERHRTLRSAIQWSHDLLDEQEKAVFRRLSVFSGGWSLEAALDICSDESLGEAAALDALDELVAKSLVTFSIDANGVPRYRMLETLGEFSREQLSAAGEEAAYRLRHLQWCHSLASKIMDFLATRDFVPYLDVVERERFNFREALQWSEQTRIGTDLALDICGYMPLFFDTRGFVAEGLRWTRSFVAMTSRDGTTEPRARALSALGWLEMFGGEPEESEWALATSVQMFRELDNRDWLGRALGMHAMTTYNRDDLEAAEAQFEEAISLSREFGNDWMAEAWCSYGLAHIELARGNFADAVGHLEHALEFSRSRELAWGVGHVQLSLGVVAFMTGELDVAMQRITDSLLMRQRLRDWRGLCDCIGVAGLIASVRGVHELAAILLGAGDVAREASGHQPVPWIQPLLEQAVANTVANLGEATYGERFDEGRKLSVDEAVDLIVASFFDSQSGAGPTRVEVGV